MRIGAVVAVALAAGLLAWFLTSLNDDGNSVRPISGPAGPAVGAGTTVPISGQGLRTLARVLEQPIYWAGTKPGYRLELTREKDGRVFIRYLPRGVKVGAKKPLLTIGTYPLENAYDSTVSAADQPNSVKLPLKRGVAFYGRAAPTSVYLSYPGSKVQVEVSDPWAPGARRLVRTGKVVPVPAGENQAPALTTAPQALNLAQLKTFARKVGHPVYWLGAKPGAAYEVSQSTDGRIFVRYLPSAAQVGSKTPYTTVGTYPVPNALTVTRARAAAGGSVRVPLGRGAVAFYASSRPTNVYVAFPDVDYQVEVYDPQALKARSRVVSGRVVRVG